MRRRFGMVVLAAAVGLLGGIAKAQTPYTLYSEFVGPPPTGPNQDFLVTMRMEGPSTRMSGYVIAVFYDSSQVILTAATDNTVSDAPPPGSDPATALDNTWDDVVQDRDGDPATDKLGIISAIDYQWWNTPGDCGLLHLTTAPTYNVAVPIKLNITDFDYHLGIDNCWVDFYNNEFHFNQPGGWTYQYNLPVSVSMFEIE